MAMPLEATSLPKLENLVIESSGYKYKSLQEDRSIRLLDLAPAANDDAPLQAELREVAFADLPQYEAISYAWGPPVFSSDLHLANGLLQITESLAAGLRRLRDSTNPRALWADAVCINQGNRDEKAKQVSMMAEIYRNSQRCLVWLGPGDIYAEKIISLFKHLATQTHRYGIQVTDAGIVGGWYEPIPEYGLVRKAHDDIPIEYDWMGADAFFSSAWFTRRWCIQEVTLAPQTLLYYGPCTITWTDLIVAATIEYRAMTQTQPRNLRLPYGFNNLRGLSHGILLWKNGIKLGSLLENFRHSACTDPRDCVYSLLGMRGPDDVEIWPNYNKPASETFTDAARGLYLHHHRSNIRLLFHAGLARKMSPAMSPGYLSKNTVHKEIPPLEEVFSEVPSWAPDWSLKGRYESIGAGRKPFAVATRFTGKVQVDADGVLSVFAQTLDRIVARKDLGDETNMYYNEHRDMLVEWKAFFDEHQSTLLQLTQEEPLVVFLRTLFADQAPQTIRTVLRKHLSAPELTARWNELRATVHRDDVSGRYECDGSAPRASGSEPALIRTYSELFNFRMALRLFLDERQLFVTERGIFGLGPAVARTGDLVVALAGASGLFVLRPDKPDAQGRLRHYIIGDCYVHGIMCGELFDALKKLGWRWFTLS